MYVRVCVLAEIGIVFENVADVNLAMNPFPRNTLYYINVDIIKER